MSYETHKKKLNTNTYCRKRYSQKNKYNIHYDKKNLQQHLKRIIKIVKKKTKSAVRHERKIKNIEKMVII